MAKYNIYRINDDKLADLKAKFISVGYREVNKTSLGSYEVTTYFTETPKLTDIWWLEQYAEFFGDHAQNKNKVYSGAIIAANTTNNQSFLVALGKTHFYAQEFIDYSFGLKLAERIGSSRGTKAQSSKHFAGQTSKSVTSFIGDSILNFSAGEATDYVKLKSNDTSKWGKAYIHFGTSVQFSSIDTDPTLLNELLSNIEQCLQKEPSFELPRIIKVKDESQLANLDRDIVQAINDDNETTLGIVDFELYGVDFIFAQQTHVRLQYEDILSDDIPELTLAAVKEFANTNEIDLSTSLRDIKAKLYVNESSKFTVTLVKLLDFVGEKCFLYRGEWYIFSDNFIKSLTTLIESVAIEQLVLEFSEAELHAWQELHREENVKYRERYVIDKMIQQNTNLQNFDRSQDYKNVNGKKTNIEVSDIYDPATNEINVVKIGGAKDFGYAFDQAIRTLSLVSANQYALENGNTVKIDALRVTLVTTNVAIPANATDINSLSFQIKLGELVNLANEKNVNLLLSFAKYEKLPKQGKDDQ